MGRGRQNLFVPYLEVLTFMSPTWNHERRPTWGSVSPVHGRVPSELPTRHNSLPLFRKICSHSRTRFDASGDTPSTSPIPPTSPIDHPCPRAVVKLTL